MDIKTVKIARVWYAYIEFMKALKDLNSDEHNGLINLFVGVKEQMKKEKRR